MVQVQNSELSPAAGENLKCPCKDHLGTVLLDNTFEIDIEYMYECLFGGNDFTNRINEARKITDIQAGEWEDAIENDKPIKKRRLEYNVGLNGALGAKSCKTIENTKILTHDIGKVTVTESESVSTGVPYSDSFMVRTRLCMVKSGPNSTRLVAHVAIIFITKPMAFIKKFIEKSCMGTISGYFTQLDQFFKEEAIKKKNEGANPVSELDNIETPTSSTKISSRRTKQSSSNKVPDKQPKSSISSTSSSYSLNNHQDDSSDHPSEDGVVDDSRKSVRLRKPPSKYTQREESTLTTSNRFSDVSTNESIHHVNANGMQTTIQSDKKEIRLIVKSDENSSNQLFFIGFEMNSSLFLNFFFLVMIVLVVFNLVLYLKLREIENLAQFIKRNKFPTTNSFSNVP